MNNGANLSDLYYQADNGEYVKINKIDEIRISNETKCKSKKKKYRKFNALLKQKDRLYTILWLGDEMTFNFKLKSISFKEQ